MAKKFVDLSGLSRFLSKIKDLLSNYLPLSGGTLTGDLKVGSSTIGTNGYIQGTWLQTTADIHSSAKTSSVAIVSSGWIYSRTIAEFASDIGLQEAAYKSVDTSISSSSTNVPTSAAVATFVEGKGYTSNTGTITGVQANGTNVATNGVANIPAATTTKYGVTQLSTSTSNTSTTTAATPSAVKAAYDLANGKQDKLTAGDGIDITNNVISTKDTSDVKVIVSSTQPSAPESGYILWIQE